MRLDSVSYRYTEDELSVLMTLQGRSEIPAVPILKVPDKECFRRGIQSLEEAGLLADLHGEILLDDIQAVIFRNLSESKKYCIVQGPCGFLSLCICDQMILFLQKDSHNRWLIEAGLDMEQMKDSFQEAAAFLSGEVDINVRNGDSLQKNTIWCDETWTEVLLSFLTKLDPVNDQGENASLFD